MEKLFLLLIWSMSLSFHYYLQITVKQWPPCYVNQPSFSEIYHFLHLMQEHEPCHQLNLLKKPHMCTFFRLSLIQDQNNSMPETSSLQVEVLVTDTTHHTGEDQSLIYDEIYRIFNTGDFSPEDKNLEIYQNIQKSDIHLVVARLTLFPYNEAAQWCFKQFNPNTATITRKRKVSNISEA
jgi:hypothetical protein